MKCRFTQNNMSKEPREAKTMTTRSECLQKGMQQGFQQGFQLGFQLGIHLGEVRLLKRLLTRRFGPLNAETVNRLEVASTEELEQCAENVLEAQSIEDVFTRT